MAKVDTYAQVACTFDSYRHGSAFDRVAMPRRRAREGRGSGLSLHVRDRIATGLRTSPAVGNVTNLN